MDENNTPTAHGPKPTIGRVVHYVLPDGPNAGDHRPAIICRTWPDGSGVPTSTVQLQVFPDGANDGLTNVEWMTSVPFDAAGAEGTWHWPERE